MDGYSEGMVVDEVTDEMESSQEEGMNKVRRHFPPRELLTLVSVALH